MKNSLLLVVDVQNCFVVPNTEHVLKPISELIERWHTNNLPVAFSAFINQPGGPWQTIMDSKKYRTKEELALHASLDIRPDDYVLDNKTRYSAWNDELTKLCKKEGINTVYICGINTDQCVLASAVEIFEHNIRPIIIEEACASTRGTDYHRMGLKLLERFIGQEQIIKNL